MEVLCGYAQTKTAFFTNPGIYTTLEIHKNEPLTAVPQAWVYLKNFYFEARYNYDDLHTLSLYFGRAFDLSKEATIELTPMIGGAFGRLKGISPALTFDLEYKKFTTASECQYTFVLSEGGESFFYDWTNFNFEVYKNIGLGGAAQIYIPKTGSGEVNYGPMANFKYKNFLLEGYAYNFWKEERFWAIAVQFAIP